MPRLQRHGSRRQARRQGRRERRRRDARRCQHPGSAAAPSPRGRCDVAPGPSRAPPPLQFVDLMSRPQRQGRRRPGRAHRQARQLAQARQVRDPARRLRRRLHLRRSGQHRLALPEAEGPSAAPLPRRPPRRPRRCPPCPRPNAKAQARRNGRRAPARHAEGRKPAPRARGRQRRVGPSGTGESAPATGKVRLFAHPGNPDAVASAASRRKRAARSAVPATSCRCASAAIVSQGTVLGSVRTPRQRSRRAPALRDPPGRRPGHDRPAADPAQLGPAAAALHPQGRDRRHQPARRDRQRRLLDVQGRTSARGALRPRHRHLCVRPRRTSPRARSTSACSPCWRSSRASG